MKHTKIMEKKQSSITHIRSWVRANGEMSEDGKSITYSCAELESVIREAKAMHKEEIIEAVYDSMGNNFDPNIGRAELYYKEKYENGYK